MERPLPAQSGPSRKDGRKPNAGAYGPGRILSRSGTNSTGNERQRGGRGKNRTASIGRRVSSLQKLGLRNVDIRDRADAVAVTPERPTAAIDNKI
jgi:hypothetical protein